MRAKGNIKATYYSHGHRLRLPNDRLLVNILGGVRLTLDKRLEGGKQGFCDPPLALHECYDKT